MRVRRHQSPGVGGALGRRLVVAPRGTPGHVGRRAWEGGVWATAGSSAGQTRISTSTARGVGPFCRCKHAPPTRPNRSGGTRGAVVALRVRDCAFIPRRGATSEPTAKTGRFANSASTRPAEVNVTRDPNQPTPTLLKQISHVSATWAKPSPKPHFQEPPVPVLDKQRCYSPLVS